MKEITVMKKVYRRIRATKNIKLLIKYDYFFLKLAEFVDNFEIKEELYGICALNGYNREFIEKLINFCNEKKNIKLLYYNPVKRACNEKNIISQEVLMNNDVVYLSGYDLLTKKPTMFNVKRIREASNINQQYNVNNLCEYNVEFELKNTTGIEFLPTEKVQETYDNKTIISGAYFDEFTAIQRMLSFGPNCTVTKPVEFREKIVSNLKEMRQIYNG